jgi:hypothetical protein
MFHNQIPSEEQAQRPGHLGAPDQLHHNKQTDHYQQAGKSNNGQIR